ncbi:hypothetical protein ABZ656_10930 [Streptomyces sp. NPDC007095]|uniref:hypothetical protein n=1 Tax=Streptomyces sp. NPDC007095 TaxID=3154482 RepID=UPI003405DB5C
MSKTVKRLPLTVQDLTTQASNEFITSYLQAQPRLAAIQAGFGDRALGAANAVRQAHSKAIVVSANGDPTEYQEMAKSGTPLKMIVADGHEFVARAALHEGICPDCSARLDPRAVPPGTGWCERCSAFWSLSPKSQMKWRPGER